MPLPPLDPWTLPTAGLEVYANRNEIKGIFQRLDSVLRGQKAIVALTGPPGVGKSVLADHLTGKAFKEHYEPPGQSRGLERATRRAKRLKLLLRVVPGQGPYRIPSLDDLFYAKKPVAGVVHVVANGFSSLRQSLARQQLENELDLEEFRALQRENEINDLRATLTYVRGAMQRHRRPFWIVIAVNKLDLFADAPSLEAAQEHYASRDGEFLSIMREFADQVGEDNVEWEVCPLSVYAESFTWRSTTVTPRLDRSQQLATLWTFAKLVEKFGGPKG